MLAKCINPSCSTPFCHLQDGRLFRLENDPALPISKYSRVEYFWLCRDCSSTMTLHLGKNATVEAVPLPYPFRSIPDDVSLALADRKEGLLLRSVSSQLPLPRGGRRRTWLRDRPDAAWLGGT